MSELHMLCYAYAPVNVTPPNPGTMRVLVGIRYIHLALVCGVLALFGTLCYFESMAGK